MGIGAVLEPLAVLVLLFGGTWINRRSGFSPGQLIPEHFRPESPESQLSDGSSATSPDLENADSHPPLINFQRQWQTRTVYMPGYSWKVATPDTSVFQDRFLSRFLWRFPFLVECWYWALVYWTYQLGRAITAVTLKEKIVSTARRHALQVIWLEEKLGVFVEAPIQQLFLQRQLLMTPINWIYSFIHIPGTIAFLVWLYYYTITRNWRSDYQPLKPQLLECQVAGPELYQSRRRTLAMCNLLAFVIFTIWPCMPPRLLSDSPDGELRRKYGFLDTVHGKNGAGSVWTENRFCNQYAAMPSLHFGYSLMIGLTIMTIPLQHTEPHSTSPTPPEQIARQCNLYSWRRIICIVLGFFYPFAILVAIIATANHFILDAVAGMLVCFFGWWFNKALLNLRPLEDYFLWLARIHKPDLSRLSSGLCPTDWLTSPTLD